MASGSPFPGMDPYLERNWLDVHARLITYAADALNDVLPDDLAARSEDRIAVESRDDETRRRYLGPDVRVFEISHFGAEEEAETTEDQGEVAVLAPYRLVSLDDPIREHYIEILDVEDGDRVVTVVEMLSPANLAGKGSTEYLDKRRQLLRGGVNVVEVCLVRAGGWQELIAPVEPPEGASATYCTLIHTAYGEVGGSWLHPMPLREPLPEVSVPLRRGDAPVKLSLQQMVDRVYNAGRYGRTVRYSRELDPPLSPADAAWADDLLKVSGRHS